jgi:hypothetical protein
LNHRSRSAFYALYVVAAASVAPKCGKLSTSLSTENLKLSTPAADNGFVEVRGPFREGVVRNRVGRPERLEGAH